MPYKSTERRRELAREYAQQRRDQLYARGLTQRGTPLTQRAQRYQLQSVRVEQSDVVLDEKALAWLERYIYNV